MIRLFFSFKGRISRQPYWLATAVVTAVMSVMAAILYSLPDECATIGSTLLLLALFSPFFWSMFALNAKRLHDRNRSAWWLLVFYPLPGLLRNLPEDAGGIGIALGLAGIALSIWAMIEFGFLRGTAGPNRYGPDPVIGSSPWRWGAVVRFLTLSSRRARAAG
jgi:uncharacterized membrane protein YhaH (DUF805 family)